MVYSINNYNFYNFNSKKHSYFLETVIKFLIPIVLIFVIIGLTSGTLNRVPSLQAFTLRLFGGFNTSSYFKIPSIKSSFDGTIIEPIVPLDKVTFFDSFKLLFKSLPQLFNPIYEYLDYIIDFINLILYFVQLILDVLNRVVKMFDLHNYSGLSYVLNPYF